MYSCNANLFQQIDISFLSLQEFIIHFMHSLKIKYNIADPSLNCHLNVVEGFEYPNDPRSYVVQGYVPLVGSPKANRS